MWETQDAFRSNWIIISGVQLYILKEPKFCRISKSPDHITFALEIQFVITCSYLLGNLFLLCKMYDDKYSDLFGYFTRLFFFIPNHSCIYLQNTNLFDMNFELILIRTHYQHISLNFLCFFDKLFLLRMILYYYHETYSELLGYFTRFLTLYQITSKFICETFTWYTFWVDSHNNSGYQHIPFAECGIITWYCKDVIDVNEISQKPKLPVDVCSYLCCA